jgi:hypothetical protein
MTNKDFEKLGKSLLPNLPGFAVKERLLFVHPVGNTLRAVYFDSSSFDPNQFFVHVFLQPLFIPAKHISLGFGWRIGGGSYRWNMSAVNLSDALSTALKREALPFLARIESTKDIVRVIESLHMPSYPYAQEAIAYAWARAGVVPRAASALQRLISSLDVNISWQCEMVERANTLRASLLSNPAEAQLRLEAWEKETLRNLNLINSAP